MPWAEGTPCTPERYQGTGKFWCQRRECVPRNQSALTRVDGGWGAWGSYSECSRTCGGGVRSRMRACNAPTPENGGKYCIGQRIQYESCNTEACGAGEMDFREQQCAKNNRNNFGIPGIPEDVRWVPKYGGKYSNAVTLHQTICKLYPLLLLSTSANPSDECKLFCRVANSNHYFPHDHKVIDGTQCSQDSFNKCVNGVCRPAACDNILYSSKLLDKCGVCDGKNDSCVDEVFVFKQQHLIKAKRSPSALSPFYHDVCTIPAGSSNIDIVQMGHLNDQNYIALMDDAGTYILNGNNIILQYPRQFLYGGVTLSYTGTNSTMERVNSSYARKLTRDLRVQIMSRTNHQDAKGGDVMMECFYTKPILDVAAEDRYRAFYGYQHHNRLGVERSPTAAYRPATTDATTALATTTTTTTTTTQLPTMMFRWSTGEWSSCNRICNGTMHRRTQCVMSSDTERERVVQDAYCAHTRPRSEEPCHTHCNF